MSAATRVFIARGYRFTQVVDVAKELGVAKGTVYLYVESKEALFDLSLRHADRASKLPTPDELPVPTPKAGQTVRYVRDILAREGRLPALEAALAKKRVGDVEAELDAICNELYDKLARHRTALKLVDRCAASFPELGAAFFEVARVGVPGALEAYFRSRADKRKLRRFADAAVAARLVMELLTFWAVHIHFDHLPSPLDEDAARTTCIDFAKHALLLR